MRAGVFGFLAITALALSSAAADPAYLAGVDVSGSPTPQIDAVFIDAIVDLTGKNNPAPGACVTPECAAAILGERGLTRGVLVAITITGDGHNFAMTASMVDDHGRMVRRRSQNCDNCAVAEATAKLSGMMSDLLDAASDDLVAVEITTTPIAAPIAIDGGAAAPTPWSGMLTAGPHQVVAGAISRDLFVAISEQPVREQIEVPVRVPTRRRFGVATYAVAGAGVVAIATGAYLIATDGDPTCAHPTCPMVKDSALGGAFTAGLGIALLGAAGAMYWLDHRPIHPVLVVAPTAEGAAAVVAGRF
jgi:hypothetical protein